MPGEAAFQSLFKDYNLPDYHSGNPESDEYSSCFNPSSRITTFRTPNDAFALRELLLVSIPLQGLQPSGRSEVPSQRGSFERFQSLFKDYNLPDPDPTRRDVELTLSFNPSSRITTFRTTSHAHTHPSLPLVSIPLQGLQPSGLSTMAKSSMLRTLVSIPLQGLQPSGPDRGV